MLKNIKIRSSFIPQRTDNILPNTTPDTTEEDPQAMEVQAIVDRIFEGQKEQMKSRASKPHSAECTDSWTCTKNPCFMFAPDNIVVHKSICAQNIFMPCDCGRVTNKVKDQDFSFDK